MKINMYYRPLDSNAMFNNKPLHHHGFPRNISGKQDTNKKSVKILKIN